VFRSEKNHALSEDKFTSSQLFISQSITTLLDFPHSTNTKQPKSQHEPQIQTNVSCGFLYGDSQGDTPKGGASGILHISHTHSLDSFARLGPVTNNFSELMALKRLLQLA
jgi:hypothetical protein